MDEFDPVSSVDMIAAALRADTSDVSVLSNVLTAKLRQVLPEELVKITYTRSMADRLAKREGHPTSIKVSMGSKGLELSQDQNGRSSCFISQIVRGVVISRKEVQLSEWIVALASELAELANSNANARQALLNLLA